MTDDQERPSVWVGHVFLRSPAVAETTEFFRKLGARILFSRDSMSVIELRGGTHIVLQAGDVESRSSEEAYFDLMVDDLEAYRQQCEADGLKPTPIERGRVHACFFLTEPGGHRFRINSTHVGSRPV